MPYIQPSLWDAVESQMGYEMLCNLEFEKAKKYFEVAMSSPLEDRDFLQAALQACFFWKEKVSTGIEGSDAKGLLQTFREFPFIKRLSAFKKALIRHIAVSINATACLEDMISLFDLLLENQEFETAGSLMEVQSEKQPEKYYLHYLLGQCFYRRNERLKAREHYSMALLFAPSETFRKRIESRNVLQLIRSYGIYEAFVYGVLKNKFSPIIIPRDFQPENADQAKAIQLYSCYLKAENARINREKAEIEFRKELKRMNSDFFKTYLQVKIQ